MEARYALRNNQLLDACQVAPEIFAQVLPRLEAFMKPFVSLLHGQAAVQHANASVSGLVSNVAHKNIASIAYRFGQSLLPLQGFMGGDAWDNAPLREAWQGHIRRHWGQGDGVVVCAPSGFPTSGRESVGVARPWWGRLGKVDHGQVALSLG
jgi:SRSO17 transposase